MTNSGNFLKLLVAAMASAFAVNATAANVIKLDSTTMAAASGWSAVPAATDVGEFDATASAGSLSALTLGGANLTLGGLKLDNNLNGPLTIMSGNTLNLGPGAGTNGIDMSVANQDMTINCLVGSTPPGSSAAWLVPAGRNLTLGANVSLSVTKQLNITNNGSILCSGTSFGFGNVGAGSGLVLAGSGSFTATNALVQVFSSQTVTTIPTATTAVPASTTTGFVVNGETVSLGQVKIGTGNSGCSMLVKAGSLTVGGSMLIGNSTSGSRWNYCEVAGGTLTVNDPTNGLQLNKQNGTTAKIISELYIHGGSMVNLSKLTFGDPANTLANTNWLIIGTNGNSGTLYIGSGGMVLAALSGNESVNCSLYGGTLGANADWASSSKVPMQLSGGPGLPFVIQAADAGATAHNITLNGPISGTGSLTKTGNGTLTLAGTNTYTGGTVVTAGKLVGVTGGSISNTTGITFAGGTLFGVQLAPAGGQFAVANVGFTNIGYLDFNLNAVTPSLTTAPLLVLGDLDMTNAVGFVFRNGAFAAGTYPIINYTGNFVGSVTNLPLGALPGHSAGYISNDIVTTKTIYLVVTNGTSEPLHWAAGNGNWDIGLSANWQDVNSATVTYQEPFGVGDQVLFDDRAAVASPVITVNTNVSPLSVNITNNAKAYTFNGTGGIGGGVAVIKSGTGSLTLANSNSFTGGLFLNGGTTVFSSLASLGAGAVNLSGSTLKFAPGNTADISAQTVSFNAGGATLDDNGQNLSFANPIGNAGAGGLTKAGSGTMTLHGGNSFNGNMVISQGTLTLASGASLPRSPSIVVSSGATYDVSAFGIYHPLIAGIGQTLAGSGSVNVNGTLYIDAGTFLSPGNGTNSVGTLTFNTYTSLQISGNLLMDVTTSGNDLIICNDATINAGANIYIYSSGLTNGNYQLLQTSSGLTINGYDLFFSQPGKTATLSSPDGFSLYLVVSDQATDNLTWSGTGSSWDQLASTDWYLTGGATPWAFTNGDVVRFDETGSVNPNVTLSGVLQPSLVVVSNPVTDYTFIDGGSSKISTFAKLVKLGAGNLTINTLDDNIGGTTIQGGTITVVGSIGVGAVTNNSHLVLQQAAAETIASITGTGDLTQNGANATVSGVANYTGPTTIASGTLIIGTGGSAGVLSTSTITNNGQLTLNSSTSWNYSMPDTGTGILAQAGTNTLTLSGVNTRSGNTLISSGKVILANANQLQGPVELEGTGVLDLRGNNQNALNLNGSSFGALILNDAGTVTNLLIINSTSAGTPQCEARVIDNDGTGGKIRVLKTGTGELFWRGTNNTYTGGTEIRQGQLRMNSSDLFGPAPVDLTGGGIYLAGTCATNLINLSQPVLPGTTNYLVCGGNITFTPPLAGTNDLLVNFVDGGSGGLTLRLSGGTNQFANVTNTIYLAGGVNYSGFMRWDTAVNMSGVTVNMDNGKVNLTSSGAQNIIVGALTAATNNAALSAASGSTFTIGGKNLSTTFEGYLGSNTGTNAVNNNLVKIGTGTLTLTGTNAFSGTTTVSNGTLVLTQDAAPSWMSTMAIGSGASLNVTGLAGGTLVLGPTNIAQTLRGSGTLNGNVSVGTNGTINPGMGIGTLTIVGNAALNGTLLMELNRTNSPATNDMLVVSGALTVGGTLTVANLGPALVGGDTFKLFPGGVSGFTATNLPALTGIKYWTNNLALNGTISVVDPVNTNPPIMAVTVAGNVLTLAWPTNAGWTLQQQINSLTTGIGTNWVDVPGSSSLTSTNITVNPNSPTVFYRLRL